MKTIKMTHKTTAKEVHKQRLLEYMSNWDNDFPNRQEMAELLGIKLVTLRFHFCPAELAEIQNEGLELRKQRAAAPRSKIYKAMQKEAEDGNVSAQKEFLDRTEGKVIDKHEHTGKDGKELFPSLTGKEQEKLSEILGK